MKSDNWRRHNRHRNICKKLNIIQHVYGSSAEEWCHNQPGRLDGNKVHCSCPSCSAKTRNKGRRLRGNYARSINYKKHDLNQMLEMDNQVQEELDMPKVHRRCKYW